MIRLHSVLATTTTAAVLLGATVASAAPADDARAHFNAIASGDVAGVMANYGDDAVFQWVGGPLDGAYSNHEAIEGVWKKFTTGQGPLKVTVADIQEAQNPKGATVTANVLFEGQANIKVRYVLTWRDAKIVNEVWQIDPELQVATGY